MPKEAVSSYKRVAKEHYKKISSALALLEKEFPKATEHSDVKMFSELYNEVPVHLTALLLRKKSKSYRRWYSALQVLPETYRSQLPYCLPVYDKAQEVYVYPNVTYNYSAIEDVSMMAGLSYACHFDIIRPFYNNYITEKNHESKKARWATFERSKKVVLKRERMSIARVLTRYTKMQDDGISDHKIRDYADKMYQEMQPICVHFCTKPEDYVEMYGEGISSCMSFTSNSSTQWRDLLNEGFHPAQFYYYHPNFGGAYIKKGGKIMARCVLFKYHHPPSDWMKKVIDADNTNFTGWHYFRMYPSEGEWAKKLKDLLAEHKITQSSHDNINVSCTFKIPGFYSKSVGDYLMPVPYIDGRTSEIHVKFDVPSKTFLLYPKAVADTAPVGGYDSGGIKKAKTVINGSYCDFCASAIIRGRTIGTDDGHTYCSTICAEAIGYVRCFDGAGNAHWVHNTSPTIIEDYYERTQKYTNAEAFRRRGGRMLIVDFLDLPTVTTFKYMTRHGNVASINGVEYAIDNHIFEQICRGERAGITIDGNTSRGTKLKIDTDVLTAARKNRPQPQKIDW